MDKINEEVLNINKPDDSEKETEAHNESVVAKLNEAFELFRSNPFKLKPRDKKRLRRNQRLEELSKRVVHKLPFPLSLRLLKSAIQG